MLDAGQKKGGWRAGCTRDAHTCRGCPWGGKGGGWTFKWLGVSVGLQWACGRGKSPEADGRCANSSGDGGVGGRVCRFVPVVMCMYSEASVCKVPACTWCGPAAGLLCPEYQVQYRSQGRAGQGRLRGGSLSAFRELPQRSSGMCGRRLGGRCAALRC